MPRSHDVGIVVWHAPLSLPGTECRGFWRTLSPSEQARAMRFRSDRDRHRYVASHGIMRRILGMWIGVAAAELRFGEEEGGKPRLLGPSTLSLPCFSLSRSGNLMLLAIAPGRVGVDIERIQGDVDPSLEGAICTPDERRALRGLPARERSGYLMALWSRKEALLKACGAGLRVPPESVEVLTPAERAGSISEPPPSTGGAVGRSAPLPGPGSPSYWFRDLAGIAGHAMTVAAEGSPSPVCLLSWPPAGEGAHGC